MPVLMPTTNVITFCGAMIIAPTEGNMVVEACVETLGIQANFSHVQYNLSIPPTPSQANKNRKPVTHFLEGF
jgi:hypothetical protein